MVTGTRQTADVRREAVLEAAMHEFAAKGYHGGSTDEIARAAGISQPYLFRLFGTKKELYLAAVRRVVDEQLEGFTRAARGKTGREALHAMGEAFTSQMSEDREHLMLMLKCWASCDDPDICDAVRESWRRLTEVAAAISGEPPAVISHFFASGTFLSVLMAMRAFEQPEPWSDRLIEGCRSAFD